MFQTFLSLYMFQTFLKQEMKTVLAMIGAMMRLVHHLLDIGGASNQERDFANFTNFAKQPKSIFQTFLD